MASVPQLAAGALLGGVAVAIVGALESLGRERWRKINGGFVDEVLALTSLKHSDVNPVIIDLIKLDIIKRRGHDLLEIVPLTHSRAKQLSNNLISFARGN